MDTSVLLAEWLGDEHIKPEVGGSITSHSEVLRFSFLEKSRDCVEGYSGHNDAKQELVPREH